MYLLLFPPVRRTWKLLTEPGFAGNTATGCYKTSYRRTGAQVQVPLFVNQGDKLKIDTRTGEYLLEYNQDETSCLFCLIDRCKEIKTAIGKIRWQFLSLIENRRKIWNMV